MTRSDPEAALDEADEMMRVNLLLAAVFLVCSAPASRAQLYFGADLSFAGQMADCGARYRDSDGRIKDIYTIFKDHGANLIRFRIWTGGNRTGYSDLLDVERGIRNARSEGMQVQLDFHYSDTWADAEHQVIPQAWAGITDPTTNGREAKKRSRAEALAADRKLADTLYNYTYYILTTLAYQGLMPDQVQVGNEINPEMLGQLGWQIVQTSRYNRPIDWTRDAMIINAGIKAVRDAAAKTSTHPRIMLQIAQPQNVAPWLAAAAKAGVTDFDLIGISYYSFHHSTENLKDLGDTIRELHKTYPDKGIMVIETSYPWTSDPTKGGNPGKADLLPGYPASIEGQKNYLFDLARTVLAAGGDGVNYWAPDQVPNKCSPRGNGSAISLFDMDGNVLPGIDFMKVRAGNPQ